MKKPSRGTCINEGCDSPRTTHVIYKNGSRKYRPMCSRCFKAGRGVVPFKEGVTPVKKDYCENKDGRLGVVCQATELQSFQLDMDHIDGDPENNQPENIQTLCKNCHALKSKLEGNSGPRHRRQKSTER